MNVAADTETRNFVNYIYERFSLVTSTTWHVLFTSGTVAWNFFVFGYQHNGLVPLGRTFTHYSRNIFGPSLSSTGFSQRVKLRFRPRLVILPLLKEVNVGLLVARCSPRDHVHVKVSWFHVRWQRVTNAAKLRAGSIDCASRD